MHPLDPHWLLFQLLCHPFSPTLINGMYRAIITRLQTGCKCANAAISSSVWALFISILSSPSPSLWLLLPCIPFFDTNAFLLNQICTAGLRFQGPWWIIYLQLTYHLSGSIGLPALTPCQPVMLISIIHWTQFPTCMICLFSCSSSCWWQWQQETLTIARLRAHKACWPYCQHWPILSYFYLLLPCQHASISCLPILW